MQRITFQVSRKPFGLWHRILAFIFAVGALALAIFLGFFALLTVLGLFVIGGIYFSILRFKQRSQLKKQTKQGAAKDGPIDASYTVIKRRRY